MQKWFKNRATLGHNIKYQGRKDKKPLFLMLLIFFLVG
jgi:hypothetical protein